MGFEFMTKIPSAMFLAIGYCLSIHYILSNKVDRKKTRNTLFVLLMTPFLLQFYQETLVGHLIIGVGVILLVSVLYGQKLFYFKLCHGIGIYVIHVFRH